MSARGCAALLLFAALQAGAADFNATDPAADPLAGPITTKVAGAPFSLQLVALNGSGGVASLYTGIVAVDLLDAGDDSGAPDTAGCRASWTPVQTILSGATFTPLDGGRLVVGGLAFGDALRVARVRVREVSGTKAGCSRDAFAVRPDHLLAQATQADAASPGTAQSLSAASYDATTQPVHRAGRPFTLRVQAFNVGGAATPRYAGTPDVQAAASLLGATLGAGGASAWQIPGGGVVQSDAAHYDEVGAATLAVGDASFAAVDAADTPDAQRKVPAVTVNVGRFIPNSFQVQALTAPVFAPACGTFSYAGQPFGFATAPVADIAAINASGQLTRNYSGALCKLPAQLPQSTYVAFNAGVDAAAVPVPDNAVTCGTMPADAGHARMALTAGTPGIAIARSAPLPPFDAEISVVLPLVSDGEAVQQGAPFAFGAATAGNGVPFLAGAKQIRFGILQLGNAYGSERLPLVVPVQAMSWSGAAASGGFTSNALDACTTLDASMFSLNLDADGDGTTVPTSVSTVLPLALGRGAVQLAAPNRVGSARLMLNLSAALLPWLRPDDEDADTVYDDAPSALASFGLFRGHDQRVDTREVFR